MFLTSRLPQFLKLFRSKHFTERIWRVHRTVDHDMGDMNAFGGKFGVERLAEHPPTSHRCGVRMLAAVPSNCRRGRGHEECPSTALDHPWEKRLREPKQSERPEAPAHLEGL